MICLLALQFFSRCLLSQTCVFRGGFDKKHQLSIVPKLDYLLSIDRALYPSCTARRITAVSCYASRRSVIISRHLPFSFSFFFLKCQVSFGN